MAGNGGGYEVSGSLLEACSCGILCPCWVGEDPDHGTCDAFNAYHIDSGTIGGIDVSGLNYVPRGPHTGQCARAGQLEAGRIHRRARQ